MRLLQRASDGGKKSGVTGFFLCEFKPLFSIVILRFNKGSRDNYHSHAFNALTWWLKGRVMEERVDKVCTVYRPSLWPKYTPRSNTHRVHALETTYAISFRGPWRQTWHEYDPVSDEYITLTHGRREIGRSAIHP